VKKLKWIWGTIRPFGALLFWSFRLLLITKILL